jgi:hypothetical protein
MENFVAFDKQLLVELGSWMGSVDHSVLYYIAAGQLIGIVQHEASKINHFLNSKILSQGRVVLVTEPRHDNSFRVACRECHLSTWGIQGHYKLWLSVV